MIATYEIFKSKDWDIPLRQGKVWVGRSLISGEDIWVNGNIRWVGDISYVQILWPLIPLTQVLKGALAGRGLKPYVCLLVNGIHGEGVVKALLAETYGDGQAVFRRSGKCDHYRQNGEMAIGFNLEESLLDVSTCNRPDCPKNMTGVIQKQSSFFEPYKGKSWVHKFFFLTDLDEVYLETFYWEIYNAIPKKSCTLYISTIARPDICFDKVERVWRKHWQDSRDKEIYYRAFGIPIRKKPIGPECPGREPTWYFQNQILMAQESFNENRSCNFLNDRNLQQVISTFVKGHTDGIEYLPKGFGVFLRAKSYWQTNRVCKDRLFYRGGAIEPKALGLDLLFWPYHKEVRYI